jgi:hypothetical protein
MMLYRYLERALRALKKTDEAEDVAKKIYAHRKQKKIEKIEAEKSLWNAWIMELFESIIDPKKDREEEEKIKKEIRASKKAWRKVWNERFKFLDGAD